MAESIALLNEVRLRFDAASKCLQMLESLSERESRTGRLTRREELLLLIRDLYGEKELENALFTCALEGFSFPEWALEEVLEFLSEVAEPGEVLAFGMDTGTGYPLFGYRVLGKGQIRPLKGALVDERGTVLETFPHYELKPPEFSKNPSSATKMPEDGLE